MINHLYEIQAISVSIVNRNEPGWYDAARHLAKNFEFDGRLLFPTRYFFIGASILLINMGFLWLWKRARQRHLRSKPLRTFHCFASSMHLNLADQWLLFRIAHRQALPTPLTLMLSYTTLHHYAHRYAQAIHPARQMAVLAHVATISQRLFGGNLQDARQPAQDHSPFNRPTVQPPSPRESMIQSRPSQKT